ADIGSANHTGIRYRWDDPQRMRMRAEMDGVNREEACRCRCAGCARNPAEVEEDTRGKIGEDSEESFPRDFRAAGSPREAEDYGADDSDGSSPGERGPRETGTGGSKTAPLRRTDRRFRRRSVA